MYNWRKELQWQISAVNDPGDINKIVGLEVSQRVIDLLHESIINEIDNSLSPHLEVLFPDQTIHSEIVLKYIKENLKRYISALDKSEIFAE